MSVKGPDNPFFPVHHSEPLKKSDKSSKNSQDDSINSKIGDIVQNRLKNHPLADRTGAESSFRNVKKGPVDQAKETTFKNFREKVLENFELLGVDQYKAEKILKDRPDGAWLVRHSDREDQTVISLKDHDIIRHFRTQGRSREKAENILEHELPEELLVSKQELFDKARSSAELGEMPFRSISYLDGKGKEDIIKMFLANQSKHFQGVGYTLGSMLNEASKVEKEDTSLGQREIRDLAILSRGGTVGLSRDGAVGLLADEPEGSWLVRYSDNEKQFVVSLKNDRGIFHIRINKRTVEETEGSIHRVLPESLRVKHRIKE